MKAYLLALDLTGLPAMPARGEGIYWTFPQSLAVVDRSVKLICLQKLLCDWSFRTKAPIGIFLDSVEG